MDTNDNRRTEEMTLGFSGIRNFDLSRDPQRQPQKKEETRGPPITTHNNMLLLWNYYKSIMCKDVEISNTRDACLRLFLRASCVFHSTAQLANGPLGKKILGSISIPGGMGLQSVYLDNSNLLRYDSCL